MLHLAFEIVRAHPKLGPSVGRMIANLGSQLYPSSKLRLTDMVIQGTTYRLNLADRFGRALFYGSRQELGELELCAQLCKPGNVFWDVGANFGLYSLACAQKVGPTGVVYAVEPNDRARRQLKYGVSANGLAERVRILKYPLSDADGTADFYAAEESAFSGLSDTHRSKIADVSQVEVFKLDTLWKKYGSVPIDVMKIDVEGHEAAVLNGAAEAIQASRDIIIQLEISHKNLDAARLQSLCQSLETAAQNGFALYGFEEKGGLAKLREFVVTKDTLPDGLEGNVFLVRRDSRSRSNLIKTSAKLEQMGSSTYTERESAIVDLLSYTLHPKRMDADDADGSTDFSDREKALVDLLSYILHPKPAPAAPVAPPPVAVEAEFHPEEAGADDAPPRSE